MPITYETDVTVLTAYTYVIPPTGYDKAKLELLELAEKIETAKRPGYTQNSVDVLENFKKAAEMTGVTPMQVWGAYFYKHTAALLSYAKDPTIPQAESLEGRFADALNYLKLGFYMIKEEEEENTNQQKLPF
jgi:LPS sulfotransferase NodH